MVILNFIVIIGLEERNGRNLKLRRYENQKKSHMSNKSHFSQSFLKRRWYFHNGCSEHLTGEKTYIEELKPYSNNYVTFGDEAKERIKGICRMVSPCLPSLTNVLLA